MKHLGEYTTESLLDMLLHYTEAYKLLPVQQASEEDIRKCKMMIDYLRVEIQKRREDSSGEYS
jgi:hypothetical protein